MIRFTTFAALLLAPALAQDATQAEASERPYADLDAIVREVMSQDHLPGAAVVIVKDGVTLLSRGYGAAQLEPSRPVDPERTLFRIGSISKALTGLALARQVDTERLSMDTPAKRFTGAIEDRGGGEAAVTIQHLLTHTAGFDQIGARDRQVRQWERPLRERMALRVGLMPYLEAGNLRLVTPPGALFRYDTYGITLAGAILERVAELPFREAMQHELFTPLGMAHTHVEVPEAEFGALAVGYGWNDGAYQPMPYEVYETTPASSIDATPADMGRLLEALTSDGANANGRFISEAGLAELLAPGYRPHPRFPGATGALWERLYYAAPVEDGEPVQRTTLRSLSHGGMNLGFTSFMDILPDHGLGIFVTANRDRDAGGGRVNLGGRVREWAIARWIPVRPAAPCLPPIDSETDVDLATYAGTYAWNVFCHSCTEEEFTQGAWRPGFQRAVTVEGSGLRIGDDLYLPTAVDDLFVRPSLSHETYFGRDAKGQVWSMSQSMSADTFERIAR